MSEVRKNEIIYEEGWREAPPDPQETTPVDEAPLSPAAAARPRPVLVMIRLVLCLLAALVLFILRAADSGVYHSLMTYYKVEMNRTLISRDIFGDAQVSPSVSKDAVQIESQSDAAQLR